MKDLLKKAWLAGILSLGFSSLGLADETSVCMNQSKTHSCHKTCEQIYNLARYEGSDEAVAKCKALDVQQIERITKVHRLLYIPIYQHGTLLERINPQDFYNYISVSAWPFIKSMKGYESDDAFVVLDWISVNPQIHDIIKNANQSNEIIQKLLDKY